MNEKFNYWCFVPSFSLVVKIISIVLIFLGLSYLGVWEYISSVSHILKEILHYGIFIFVGLYLIYYEVDFLSDLRILVSGVRDIVQEKIEDYDKTFDEHLLEEVDEQITCFSRFLQHVLLMINIPEEKVQKVKVKSTTSFIVRWLLVYPAVLVIIIFWDLFYRTILPFAWAYVRRFFTFLYNFFDINYIVSFILDSRIYKSTIEMIELYDLKNILLVISFSSLFALMEAMGAFSLILLTGGSFLLGSLMYAAKFAVFIPIHSFHDAKAEDMRKVSWFKVREEDIFSFFSWFEQLNVYKRVMGVLKKVKAIFKTILLQLKNLVSAIKALAKFYYINTINKLRLFFGFDKIKTELSEEIDFIDEIKMEHDSLWRNVVNNFKLFFDGFSDILSKESKCLDLKDKMIDAYEKLKFAKKDHKSKSIGGFTTAFNKAKAKYEECIGELKGVYLLKVVEIKKMTKLVF